MLNIPRIFDSLIDGAVDKAKTMGCYMPAIATFLRLKAGELADKYPDDTNGGRDEL